MTPISSNNLTVNITAKSNIPQDIVESKLLFFDLKRFNENKKIFVCLVNCCKKTDHTQFQLTYTCKNFCFNDKILRYLNFKI